MAIAVEKTDVRTQAKTAPLQSGDRLSRVEFERLYAASPNIKKAELVEGIVYMPSPTHFEQHGRPHSDLITWLGLYRAHTPGTIAADNVTVRIDHENEVQPDALLRLDASLGGRSSVSDDDYLEGPPELIIEIAASSASYDMNQKRRVYARTGVPEYVVLLTYEERVVWFVLREGVFGEMQPDADGVLRSEIFPGLWLDAAALIRGDLSQVLAVLQKGIDSDEHSAYAAKLYD